MKLSQTTYKLAIDQKKASAIAKSKCRNLNQSERVDRKNHQKKSEDLHQLKFPGKHFKPETREFNLTSRK